MSRHILIDFYCPNFQFSRCSAVQCYNFQTFMSSRVKKLRRTCKPIARRPLGLVRLFSHPLTAGVATAAPWQIRNLMSLMSLLLLMLLWLNSSSLSPASVHLSLSRNNFWLFSSKAFHHRRQDKPIFMRSVKIWALLALPVYLYCAHHSVIARRQSAGWVSVNPAVLVVPGNPPPYPPPRVVYLPFLYQLCS